MYPHTLPGDVFSIRVPGKTLIVLNSERVAHDLLEKRSAIYSDRVRFAYYDRYVSCLILTLS